MGAAGSLAAAFAQPLIGWIIDTYSYEPVFLVVSLMHLVSAACVSLLIPRIAALPPPRPAAAAA